MESLGKTLLYTAPSLLPSTAPEEHAVPGNADPTNFFFFLEGGENDICH